MTGILWKLRRSLNRFGVGGTLRRISRALRPDALRLKVFGLPTAKDRFRAIYKHRYWLAAESASGTGSTMAATQQIRAWLPGLLRRCRVRTFLDAPCGDWNWMKTLVEEFRDIEYIGGDIVPELIEMNRRAFKHPGVSFVVLDITRDPLPSADLMMVRDCLFHLSFEDIDAFLANFAKSDIAYCLTSTHVDAAHEGSKDIVTGDFRLIDITKPPFNFDAQPLERFPDTTPGEPPREMWLLSREQVLNALAAPVRLVAR